MTIKEHIAFCKQVLNRIRNEDPEAINPILEEMSQWQRVDALVRACHTLEPTQTMGSAAQGIKAVRLSLAELAAFGDIEPAQVNG